MNNLYNLIRLITFSNARLWPYNLINNMDLHECKLSMQIPIFEKKNQI